MTTEPLANGGVIPSGSARIVPNSGCVFPRGFPSDALLDSLAKLNASGEGSAPAR